MATMLTAASLASLSSHWSPSESQSRSLPLGVPPLGPPACGSRTASPVSPAGTNAPSSFDQEEGRSRSPSHGAADHSPVSPAGTSVPFSAQNRSLTINNDGNDDSADTASLASWDGGDAEAGGEGPGDGRVSSATPSSLQRFAAIEQQPPAHAGKALAAARALRTSAGAGRQAPPPAEPEAPRCTARELPPRLRIVGPSIAGVRRALTLTSNERVVRMLEAKLQELLQAAGEA